MVSLSGAWSQAASRTCSASHQGPRLQASEGPLAGPQRTALLRAAVAGPRLQGARGGPLAGPRRVMRLRAAVAEDMGVEDASSYYSLLGISPSATQAEVKTAYRALMRDFHPDKSNDDDAVDFAVFINEIYEVRQRLPLPRLANFAFVFC